MVRNMINATFVAALICAASSAAMAGAPSYGCPSAALSTTTCINGGGSSLAANVYAGPTGEMTTFAAATGGSTGIYYEKAGSGAGQKAFLLDDPSQFGNGDAVGAFHVEFGASDSFVTATNGQNLSGYVGANKPMPSGGQFIQIPMFATPITIPLANAKMVKNGSVTLNDTDLCGIFSGKFTNWNQTSVAKLLTAGTIKVYWRDDNLGSGTSFLLTQHLASVCTTANTAGAPFKGFTATTKFASLFTGYTGPASGDTTTLYTIPTTAGAGNFVGAKGSGGVADGVNNDTTKSAIGYVSPDYTSIAATPAAQGSGLKPYTSLYVASVLNHLNNVAYLPTVANVNTAITNAGAATYATPPATLAAAQNQGAWVPEIATPAAGYPIVGYTNLVVAQCYANKNVATSLLNFLTKHIQGGYTTLLQNNGFVPTLGGSSSGIGKALAGSILTNQTGWNLNIQNPTACKGVTGRK